MYSVEMESDYAVITIMSEFDNHEDVQVIIEDKGNVYIRQFNEKRNKFELISMDFRSMMDMVSSVDSPEGFFKISYKNS